MFLSMSLLPCLDILIFTFYPVTSQEGLVPLFICENIKDDSENIVSGASTVWCLVSFLDPITTTRTSTSTEVTEILEAQPSQIDEVFVKIIEDKPQVRQQWATAKLSPRSQFQLSNSKSRNQIYAPKFCLKLRSCIWRLSIKDVSSDHHGGIFARVKN